MNLPTSSDYPLILHGDCVEEMRQLPEASVHAVVTDPPYGINFMGKAWDAPGGMLGQMATGYADNDNAAFGAWCETWLTECLRVLKPGGHLLAFGGTRTWHRLACAVEDAGFEVRDSIAWLYGSGFPKSLDVSKAIDKRANVNDETHRRIALVAEVIRTHREAKGMERAEVSRAVVGTPSGACWNWEHHQLPSAEMWPAIKRVLDIPDKFDGLIEGTRAQFIGAEREVIGARLVNGAEGSAGGYANGIASQRGLGGVVREIDITAPATTAAQQWDGWGTALKPSFEGIVCATKPVPALARIGSRLDELEQSCIPPASGAVPSSAPTHPDSLGARTASAPASAATRREDEPARTTPTGAAAGSPAATATSASELTGATFWNTVTSWKACWAELCEATSTSTTGTTSSTTTDLETLWCCLSQITPESTTTDPTSPDGLSSFVGAVDAMFAAAVLNSRATRTLTAIGSATSGTPSTSPAAGGSRAAFEPVVVARKPLASPGVNVLSVVESELRERGVEGAIQWTNGPVSGAVRLDPLTSSSSTGAPPAGEISAAPAAASETPSDARPTDRSSATNMPNGATPTASTSAPTPSAGPLSCETRCSTPTAESAPAATSASGCSSPSTTSTEAAPSTARRRGARSTTRSSGSGSLTVTESFAGIATGLSGSWATVRIDRLEDGTCVWPDGLPRSTAGGQTVAANVLEHGTGALNIDACRIGDGGGTTKGNPPKGESNGIYGNGINGACDIVDLGKGRWPANVVLDETQAEALDEQSGIMRDGVAVKRNRDGKPQGVSSWSLPGEPRDDTGYGGSGGASRFFYVAKADTTERPTGNGTAHPTVKPLDLMRWLVRLVTPPGGIVLEPFAGSGTTVEACIKEDVRCVAIEREADYLPLIDERINRNNLSLFAGGAS